jgi:hypothetical protein
MPVTTRILETESASTSVKDPPVASRRAFLFNRRKEIIYGSAAKMNPARTAARRFALVSQKIGPAVGFYYWLVERIGSTDRTRFWIADAAEANNVSSRTIKNHNKRLQDAGFIKINHRRHEGQNTYAEYVLLPINYLIGDDGQGQKLSPGKGANRVKSFSPGPSEKAFTAKRAINKTPAHPSGSWSSHSTSESSSEGSGSGPSASAPASSIFKGVNTQDTQGFDSVEHLDNLPLPAKPLREEVTSWCKQNHHIISDRFMDKPYQSFRDDILRYTLTRGIPDSEKWDLFITDIWPRLQIMLPNTIALSRCGAGWMFKTNPDSGQPYFMDIIASTQYRNDKFTLPKTIRDIRTACFDPYERRMVTITGYASKSYQVCLPETPDTTYLLNVWDAQDEPPAEPPIPADPVPPAEPPVVASLATPEPREPAKAVPTPAELAKAEENAALLAALSAE